MWENNKTIEKTKHLQWIVRWSDRGGPARHTIIENKSGLVIVFVPFLRKEAEGPVEKGDKKAYGMAHAIFEVLNKAYERRVYVPDDGYEA